MYLKSATLLNVRSIERLEWEVIPGEALPGPGWNVVIGDNGAGKSTFLRAIALALVGPSEAAALRQDWNEWLRVGAHNGMVFVQAEHDTQHDTYSHGARITKRFLPARLDFVRVDTNVELRVGKTNYDPLRYFWGSGSGWFSASYGPFRRFTGGDKDQEKLYYARPKLARHLSVFGESVALSECLEWLKLLQFKKLERDPEGELLSPLEAFINQRGFLPHGTRLNSITSKGVLFVDGNGAAVAVEQLSDGYRSILSMTLELIRQLAMTYGPKAIFSHSGDTIIAPGVVLIDEVDAHLHPTWQRRIGTWFRQRFPKLQFIVTTHSPFICQAADVGTIFQLARPGDDAPSRMIEGAERDRLLYGSILDAYATGMFGDGITRSPESLRLMTRLAELNARELDGQLTPDETSERNRLRTILPTAATDGA